MKNKRNFFKLFALLSLVITLYFVFNNSTLTTREGEKSVNLSSLIKKTKSEKITGYKIKVEVQNGCGYKGLAKLYTSFLRGYGYDVIDYRNASRFDYEKTQLIIYKKNEANFVEEAMNLLQIDPTQIYYKFDENIIYEMTVIIGKDFNHLNSYDNVAMYYEPF